MFSHILSPIGKAIASGFLALSVLFGGHSSATLGAIQPVADFRSSLTSGITSSATTMTLVSTSTASGENLVQGKTYGFKLGGREYVLGTLSAGKQITGLTRGVSLITGTTTGGVAEAWGRGTAVEVTDAPLLLQISNKVSGTEYFDSLLTYASNYAVSTTSNQLAPAWWVKSAADVASTSALSSIQTNSSTFTGANTFSGINSFTGASNSFTNALTLTGGFTASATSTLSSGALVTTAYKCTTGSSSLQLCDKAYIDGVAVAGASNANDTTKGIVQTATNAQAAAGTSLGSTGARLALGANLATSTSQVAQNSVVVTNTLGKIDPSFLTSTGYTFSTSTTTAATSTNANVSSSLTVGSAGTLDVSSLGKNTKICTSNCTWTKANGVTRIKVTVIGGGATGGVGNGSNTRAGGGGSGATCIAWLDVTATSTVNAIVGTGGAQDGSTNTVGNNGTLSAFSSYCMSRPGLGGGTGLSAAIAEAASSTFTGITSTDFGLTINGDQGQSSSPSDTNGWCGMGGSTPLGFGGRPTANCQSDTGAPTGYGSGSAGTYSRSTPARDGVVIIEW